MTLTLLSIIPEGAQMTDVYKTDKDYQEFRERYMEAVASEMRENDLKRARSERDIMYKIFD